MFVDAFCVFLQFSTQAHKRFLEKLQYVMVTEKKKLFSVIVSFESFYEIVFIIKSL